MDWLMFAFYGALIGYPVINGLRFQLWRHRGRSLGLEFAAEDKSPPKLTGWVRDHQVTVTRSKHRLAVRMPGIDPKFTLGRDSSLVRAVQSDIEIGDAEFDEIVRVEGDRDFAIGLLHEEARRAVLRLVREVGGTVANGRVEVLVYRFKDIPDVLEPMADVAQHLRGRTLKHLPALMARTALEDSSPEVRLRAFRQLAEQFHGSSKLPPTAKKLLTSDQIDLRLEAADQLLWAKRSTDRDKAARVMTALAAERNLDEPTRRRALEALARSNRAESAFAVCRQILSAELGVPPKLRRAAIANLVKAQAMQVLLDLETSNDTEEMELLARGLGQTSSEASGPENDPKIAASIQTRLLDLLGHPAVEVQIAAATSLGAIGTVHAVEALRKAAASGALYRSPLARAAETAVQQIQERLGGSQAGEISLSSVSPLEGAVSPADGDESGEGGEVSLA